MKKFIPAILLVFLLLFTACSDDTDQTTENAQTESQTVTEETTRKTYSLSEMSPDTTDVTLPQNIEIKVSAIDFDSFTEIDAEDSVLQNAGHDKILESEDAQYFFVDGDIKIHGIFFDENKRITYSASYNTDTGFCEFIGDNEKSWYFNETGELSCVVYTFTGDKGEIAPIYTFYNADGTKDVTRTGTGWFTPDFSQLSEAMVLDAVSRYSYTIEATVKY